MDLLKIMQKMSVCFPPEKGKIFYFFADDKWWALFFFSESKTIREVREFLLGFKSNFPLEFAVFPEYHHINNFSFILKENIEGIRVSISDTHPANENYLVEFLNFGEHRKDNTTTINSWVKDTAEIKGISVIMEIVEVE